MTNIWNCGSENLCLTCLLAALLAVTLAAPARAQDSLSDPISPSLSDPIYSESVQTGPSSSLLPGGSSLTLPSLRTGINDPLGFLIETSSMSPYPIGGGMVSSYADAELPNQLLLNDSMIASHVSQYRNNSLLMSGAGAASTPAGRALTPGGMVSARAGTDAAGAGASAFSRIGAAAPFAAGSSMLAQQSSSTPTGSFVDPNMLATEMSSAAGVAAMQSDPDAAGAALASMQSGTAVSADTMGYSQAGLSGVAPVESTSMFGPMAIPSADSVAFGAAPGEVFPNVSMALPATSGFPDSTMGTAGLPFSTPDQGYTSPLLAPEMSGSGPFPSVSEEDSSQLHPTLFSSASLSGGDSSSVQLTAESFNEVARRARMHDMIYNPGAPLPSTFDMRKLKREYLRQNSGGQAHHRSTLTAPTIKP